MRLIPTRASGRAPSGPGAEAAGEAPYGATLALTVTLAAGGFLVAMSIVLLLVHPPLVTSAFRSLIGQNQSAKTALYLFGFAVLLPGVLLTVPRLADRIAWNSGASALSGLAAGLVGTLAAMLIAVKLSGSLPWGDGLGTLLAGTCLWWALAAGGLARAARGAPWRLLPGLASRSEAIVVGAGLLVLGVLLCLTRLRSVSVTGLVLAAIVAAAALVTHQRLRLPGVGGLPSQALDVVAVLILLLAVPDLVVFHASSALPNVYFPPGVIQFQQDWILEPTNQLLAGGAVLVNAPSSQYGVGLLYFLAGYFHLAPIGYGTFGLLDGLLTALVYIIAYAVLRIAGVGRLLAAGAMAFAVAVLLYNLPYSVGALPEEGPLRFGMPIAVILARVSEDRWPHRARAAHLVALAALAVASVWALEAFAYTAFTFVSLVALDAWLMAPARRRDWLLRQAGFAVGAIVGAHLILAGATLAGTGRLPDWTQYLAYLRGLLLGGRQGMVTYGFSHWSPGLAVGVADFASAAAVVLLVRRSDVARRRRTLLAALTGSTAYAIACFSYIDNRSSTYLLLYTSLPLLMAATLWLGLLLGAVDAASQRLRAGGLAFVLGLGVLMLGAAWPSVGDRFSRTALAHAYPGGALATALHRLVHPPPIDPRAPEGERLLKRYLPHGRVLILLPPAPDLAIEIELRLRRASSLFIGDPSQDIFVPSVWTSKIASEISSLRPGRRALLDESALRDVRFLRHRPADYVLDHPLAGSNAQLDWILHRLDERFRLVLVHADRQGFVIVTLQSRR